MQVSPQELVELFQIIGQRPRLTPTVKANLQQIVRPSTSRTLQSTRQRVVVRPSKEHMKPVKPSRIEGFQIIVDLVTQRYPLGNFSTHDAKAMIKKELDKRGSTTGYAITWGVNNGQLRKIRQGVYSCAKQSPYETSKDSIVDIVATDFKTMQSVFKILYSVRDNHFLTIDKDQGISARFSDKDSFWQGDLVVKTELFDSYWCSSRAVRIALSYGDIAKILAVNRSEPFHLKLPRNDSHLEVGGIGNEHKISFLDVKVSKVPFEPKLPLPVVSGRCSMELSRDVLLDILKNAAVHSHRLSISCEPEKATFSSLKVKEEVGYVKAILPGPDTKISCRAAAKVVYDVNHLMPLVRAADVDKLSLQFDSTVLKVGIDIHPAVRFDFYLAPIKEEPIQVG